MTVRFRVLAFLVLAAAAVGWGQTDLRAGQAAEAKPQVLSVQHDEEF